MENFIYPDFDGKSLLNIPSTILKIFGIKPLKKLLPANYYREVLGSEKIILFLIDGFGDNLYKTQAVKYPFFDKIIKRKFYQTITSVFPSTTAAAISTINCGLSPFEHGLPEWNVYFREIDAVIQTLPFLPILAGDLPKMEKAPEGMLYNEKTIYQILAQNGIPSYSLIYKSYSDSLFNRSALAGSHVIPYHSLADFFVRLKDLLTNKGKAYIFAYYAPLDTASHNFGPQSEEVKGEISMLSYMMQEELINKLPKSLSKKTGVFLTSDHGQIEADPTKTIFLDEIEGFESFLAESKEGRLIPPSGSSRDVFLHIKEEKLLKAEKYLVEKLKGKAEVIKTSDFINKGVFGNGVMHGEFGSRIGNLLVLAHGKNAFWYHFAPDTELKFKGKHGGLSAMEMLIPFVCFNAGSLQE